MSISFISPVGVSTSSKSSIQIQQESRASGLDADHYYSRADVEDEEISDSLSATDVSVVDGALNSFCDFLSDFLTIDLCL